MVWWAGKNVRKMNLLILKKKLKLLDFSLVSIVDFIYNNLIF